MIEQKILPVLSDWKMFEKFMKMPQEWCVLMGFHINFMEELILRLHERGKKGIVHMDLLKGIQNDEFGTQFVCQKLHADGIISTRPKVIQTAKQNHCVTILRVFMIDSRSILRDGTLANTIHPDYVEILPAVIPDAVALLHAYCDTPVIGGGLIRDIIDIENCMKQGMVAITTSNLSFCEKEG